MLFLGSSYTFHRTLEERGGCEEKGKVRRKGENTKRRRGGGGGCPSKDGGLELTVAKQAIVVSDDPLKRLLEKDKF